MRGQSVLVVEDSPLNARLMQLLLSRAGLLVTLAGDAERALEILAGMTPLPDLILMDMQLPGMSGCALTRLLRANPLKRGIPILAVTANDSSADRQIMMDAGCDGFVSKTIGPADFVSAISSFLAAAEASLSVTTPSQ